MGDTPKNPISLQERLINSSKNITINNLNDSTHSTGFSSSTIDNETNVTPSTIQNLDNANYNIKFKLKNTNNSNHGSSNKINHIQCIPNANASLKHIISLLKPIKTSLEKKTFAETTLNVNLPKKMKQLSSNQSIKYRKSNIS